MKAKCSVWLATLNTMPGHPPELLVVGDVEVPNPGVSASLTRRAKDANTPNEWVLDLHLVQRPGSWLQVVTCTQARWTRVLAGGEAKPVSIEVRLDDEPVAFIDVIKELQ